MLFAFNGLEDHFVKAVPIIRFDVERGFGARSCSCLAPGGNSSRPKASRAPVVSLTCVNSPPGTGNSIEVMDSHDVDAAMPPKRREKLSKMIHEWLARQYPYKVAFAKVSLLQGASQFSVSFEVKHAP